MSCFPNGGSSAARRILRVIIRDANASIHQSDPHFFDATIKDGRLEIRSRLIERYLFDWPLRFPIEQSMPVQLTSMAQLPQILPPRGGFRVHQEAGSNR